MGPIADENDPNSDQQASSSTSSRSIQRIQSIIGLYFDDFHVTFKLTHQIHHQQLHSGLAQDNLPPKNYTFKPFINCHLKGNQNKTDILFVSAINLVSSERYRNRNQPQNRPVTHHIRGLIHLFEELKRVLL